MKLFYCDHYAIPLPPGHKFPMAKYALIRELLAAGLRGARPFTFWIEHEAGLMRALGQRDRQLSVRKC